MGASPEDSDDNSSSAGSGQDETDTLGTELWENRKRLFIAQDPGNANADVSTSIKILASDASKIDAKTKVLGEAETPTIAVGNGSSFRTSEGESGLELHPA